MSYSSTSAAATSSCVESGLEAQSTTSAPPAFEPCLDGRPQGRLAVEPSCGRDVGELDPEAPAQLEERAELVELQEPVRAVAVGRALRHDQLGCLQVAEHSRRPARLGGRF